MRSSGKLYTLHVADIRAHRVPLSEPERGKAHRCLNATVYMNWLMYESEFKGASAEEIDEVVETSTTCPEVAQWQSQTNTYWIRWITLTHKHQYARTLGFEQRDGELAAQHIGDRHVKNWHSAIRWRYHFARDQEYRAKCINTCKLKQQESIRLGQSEER
ncbi:hypothetical protein SARC_06694 [Sphaeroforma arctica JP610]|uniref:Uncharacterized protein n=1 Tax=Sphaeroforma arctica JP610 TaxID=667725 RepID=A0A0L0FVU9_9EUKA|nr:hypothetical protein SARC_06694 [Sphaeroforma arctica JP610]KNC80962.1 hypothetical protein SARC_06694 [Sphaeroforma arctica JP610]|eukprot:XP_014154864.1 hypothetical protein SARC_06694 [Sphaeroforma arctica JP610]